MQKTFVIFTVMVGNYGHVHQPLIVDDRFDYILFSNDINDARLGIWQIRKIPEMLKGDNKRLSRYPKTHPETLLAEYKASLYIDANIQIADQWVYNRFFECVESNFNTAGVQLVFTGRDCTYRHAYDMCAIRAEHDFIALKQCQSMMKLGFPEHYGLNENNVIFRMHNEIMQTVDEEWWWWITNYSYRDQFSYMYCLWKYKIKREFFLPVGEDTRNTTHFILYQHNHLENVAKRKWVKCGPFEWLRNQSRMQTKENYDKYCEHWLRLCKKEFPILALFLWGTIYGAKGIALAIAHRIIRK